MNNDLLQSTRSPSKQPAASPWKKPKLVSFIKTKSLKRKSEIFNLNSPQHAQSLNETTNSIHLASDNSSQENFADGQKAFKTRKTNHFSVTSAPSAVQNIGDFTEKQPASNENDLYSFFYSSKDKFEANLDEVKKPSESDDLSEATKIIKGDERLAALDLSKQFLINSALGIGARSGVNGEQSALAAAKETFLFEDEHMLPIDWSLKIRLRFLSTKQFTCYTGIRSNHETDALINFSNFKHFYDDLFKIKQRNDLYKTALCEAISYWTFPYLPWLNLYPRNVGVSNLTSEPLNVDIQKSLSKSWQQSLKSLFNSLKNNQCPYFYLLTPSFTVLFRAQSICGMEEIHAILTPSTKGLRQSLKDISFTMPLMSGNLKMNNGNNPLDNETSNECTSDFVLNGGGVRDQSLLAADGDVSNAATITADETSNCGKSKASTKKKKKKKTAVAKATSKVAAASVLASTLLADDENAKDGADFDEENAVKSKGLDNDKGDQSDDGEDDDDEEEEEDEESDDEPDEWLEQIGLNSAVNFKASILQRNNKNINKDSLLNFDNRPRSTLLFTQGGDVQALFNFLLNSKSCMANSGPLTGVPPTLLSPLPFLNASMQKLKVEQNVIKSLKSNGESLTQYAVDLVGPIMPYHMHRLCNTFRLTQSSEFEMTAHVYQQSASLNCVKKPEVSSSGVVDEESMSPFLDVNEKNSLQKFYGIFGEAKAISSVKMVDGMFCCN